MSSELDLLVAPFGRPIDAGDQTRAVDPPEVAVDERVPCLGLIGGAFGQPEMPQRVLVPRMALQVGVLIISTRLNLAPVAVEHILASVDQRAGVGDGGAVERV